MCVTLNEGYLRAADRSGNNLLILKSKHNFFDTGDL